MLVKSRPFAQYARCHILAALSRYGGNPIVSNGGGTGWKSTDVGGVNVFYDAPNARWVMNFGGWGSAGQTGLAYNQDIADLGGWVEEDTNPIWSASAAFGESTMASNGSMVVMGGAYYFAYQTMKGGVNRIVMASGPSLLELARLNGGAAAPALGSPGDWDSHQHFDPMLRVSDDGATLQLYYAADDETTRGIGWATSSDGITWIKRGRLISSPAGIHNLGEPAALFEGEAYSLTTDIATGPGIRRSAQFVTVDGGVSWAGPQVILGPGAADTWDSAQVFDMTVVIHDGIAYAFYAGADTYGGGTGLNMQIGVATMAYPYNSITG